MKTLFILGACALLSLTIFSCTADDYEDQQNKKVEKPAYADGPGDLPITVPPPPVKD
jgi:hypothetical protein